MNASLSFLDQGQCLLWLQMPDVNYAILIYIIYLEIMYHIYKLIFF